MRRQFVSLLWGKDPSQRPLCVAAASSMAAKYRRTAHSLNPCKQTRGRRLRSAQMLLATGIVLSKAIPSFYGFTAKPTSTGVAAQQFSLCGHCFYCVIRISGKFRRKWADQEVRKGLPSAGSRTLWSATRTRLSAGSSTLCRFPKATSRLHLPVVPPRILPIRCSCVT